MLEDSLIESRSSAQTRKPLTVLLSTVTHVAIVVMLLVLPLVQPEALPRLDAMLLLRPPAPRVNERPSPPESVAPIIQRQIVLDKSEFIAPTQMPREIAELIESPVTDNAGGTIRPQASAKRDLLQIVGQSNPQIAEPPPPLPQVPDAPAPKILRVSAGLQTGNLIFQPKPVYPTLAKQARVQGVVVIEAVIAADGTIDNLRLISGHPLLTSAAIDAVKQWRYRPTLLSGEPVQVITTVTVTFSLQ